MIEELLPAAAEVAERYDDAAPAPLFAAEEAVVARAVPERRREFGTTRACARTALAGLGVAPAPILPGRRGAPVWPAGVVGSMTHCAGYRAAVVARADEVMAVGVDAEPNLPLPGRQARELVTLPQERVWLTELRACRPGVCWDRLVFSAKESVYKAWYPLTGRPLDFADAEITFDPWAGTFTARLAAAAVVVNGRRVAAFHGRWLVRGGLLLTAIAPAAVGAAEGANTAASTAASTAATGAVAVPGRGPVAGGDAVRGSAVRARAGVIDR
ncbi:4'-phosphopantetheinyl transferase [Streptomyces armeniacus]|uniref:4'-phosphopantetheinyl transferase n=1 Tax=Streptomyces armeniacus TaxID=83291 RepID=A0A345XLA0_9ACTN|nr:4'-phosphopantetheinyl transferase [Streptomyces armeniacus]